MGKLANTFNHEDQTHEISNHIQRKVYELIPPPSFCSLLFQNLCSQFLVLNLCFETYWVGRRPKIFFCGPWLLVWTQRRIWGLTCGINTFFKERTEHLKWEMEPSPEKHTGMMRYGLFKTGLLLIHLGGHRLIVLIDSRKWHNRLSSARLPIVQSVIIRYMHVQCLNL